MAQSPAARLDLAQVRRQALAHSPDVRQYQARLQEAHFKVDETYSQASPTLKILAGASRITPPVEPVVAGRMLNITPEYNYFSTLTMRQSLLTFGRLEWSTAAAELAEKAHQAELEERISRVLEEATLAYLETLLSSEQVSISQDLLQARQAHLQEARSLVEVGTAAPFEVKRNQAALAQSQQLHLDNLNTARLARLRLFSLLQSPDQGQTLEPVSELPPAPQEDLKQALARRLDLAAQRWAVEAARARVERTQAQDNPNLFLQSDYTLRNATSFLPARQWSVGLQLEIPLFDGGLNQAQTDQAGQIVEQLLAVYEQSERQARLELEALLLEIQSRRERLDVLRTGLEAAQEAVRIARLRYRNGLGTNVELLDSEAAHTSARQDLAVARYRYLQSITRYHRAAALKTPDAEGNRL
jgi:outer membrane protein TolC